MEAKLVPAKTKWSLDQAHSEIGFRIKHLLIAHVKGTFKTFDANIYTASNDFFNCRS